MTKNILTESTKSKFKVLDHKPKNVLKRIQGVLSDFKTNRNGRIYPRELWENVLNSDYVKEMIENHGLVGELDHPEERLEISLQNVSHVINDMWIEGDQVLGTIDILPTPSGKIVSELLDYGTDIGISSRGAGSVGAGNIVDPDYQFVTFDFVARPSCEAARLNMIVEGVQVEIDNNSDDKVKSILEGYKETLKEDSFKDMVSDLHSYVEADPSKISKDLKDAIKNNKLTDYLKSKAAMTDEEITEFKNKYSLNEAKTVDFEYIGKDDWGRHIIKSKETGTYFGDGNLTRAGKERDLSHAAWYTYSGNDPYEGEPEVSMNDDIIVNIVNPEDIPTDYQREEYQLLGRLKSDCDYFLGNGNGYEGHLWAGSVDKQIAKMRELYDQLEEKPEWLNLDDINTYERKMKHFKGLNESVESNKDRFIDYCKGKIKNLGKVKVEVNDWDSEEYDATKLANVNVSLITSDGLYMIDFDDSSDIMDSDEAVYYNPKNKELIYSGQMSSWEENIESLDFKAISKKLYNYILEFWDDHNFDAGMNLDKLTKESDEKIKRELKLPKPFKYNIIHRLGGSDVEIYCNKDGVGGAKTTTVKDNEYVQDYFDIDGLWDVEIYKNGKYKGIEQVKGWQNAVSLLQKQLDSSINESINLNEAMSDQEVYKTVLGWYKQQIESGNMTLNQCYSLLSDKAKVSLNKMVNLSNIKENIMNDAINKLINESIILNERDTSNKDNWLIYKSGTKESGPRYYCKDNKWSTKKEKAMYFETEKAANKYKEEFEIDGTVGKVK